MLESPYTTQQPQTPPPRHSTELTLKLRPEICHGRQCVKMAMEYKRVVTLDETKNLEGCDVCAPNIA